MGKPVNDFQNKDDEVLLIIVILKEFTIIINKYFLIVVIRLSDSSIENIKLALRKEICQVIYT